MDARKLRTIVLALAALLIYLMAAGPFRTKTAFAATLLSSAVPNADNAPAAISSTKSQALQVPTLKWQHGGCYASWCETGWYSSPAVADLDGDGTMEVVAGAYTVFILNGEDGTVHRAVDTPGERLIPGVVIADIDDDGDVEIITAQGSGYLNVLDDAGDAVWSRRPTSSELRGLSVYDLDSDGTLEIVVTAAISNKLNTWVYEHDGSVRSGWPQLDDNSAYAAGVYNDNAAIYDIDNDGMGEIILPTDVHYISGYEPDGTQIPANSTLYGSKGWGLVGVWEDYDVELRGWGTCTSGDPRAERYRPNFAHTPASIADMDGDGNVEIVSTGNVYDCIPGYPSRYTGVYIFNPDRSRFNADGYDWRTVPIDTGAPWSEDWNVIESAFPNPVLADLDGDGEKEVLYASYDGRMHVFWLDKTEHHNWPYAVYSGSGPYRFASEPAVADLDSDGVAEVIFTSWVQKGSNQTGKLHILDYQGNILYEVDLPAAYGSSNWNGALAAPTLANIDADAELEAVLNTAHSGFVAYDLPGTADAHIIWGTGRGNYQRTGSLLQETVPPSNPSSLISSSHTEGAANLDNTVDMTWSSDASDGDGSGVAGYSVTWTQSATTLPDMTVDLAADTYTTTSEPLAGGEWYFHLRTCDNAGNCAAAMHAGPYVITVPALVSPADGSATADNTPEFSWDAVPGATQYEIQIADSVNFSNIVIETSASSLNYTVASPLADRVYYWRVRVDNGSYWSSYSEAWVVTVDTTPPAIPTLLLPIDGSTTSDNTPEFNWGNTADATEYQIQVSSNTEFSSLNIDETLTSSTYTPTNILVNGTYYWHIRARDAAGNWSSYSSAGRVLIAAAPVAATLVSPIGGETVADDPVTYQWNEVTGATEYYLWVNDAAGTNVYKQWHNSTVVCSGGLCSLAPALAYTNDTSYSWWIQARNSYGTGLWSDPATFVFDCPTCVPPGVATLTSPSGGETVTSAPVTYTWEEVTGADDYYLWINNAAGTTVYKQWHSAATVCSGGVCSFEPVLSYTSGTSYSWWIQARNGYGDGLWSSAATFTFDDGSGPPGAATLTSPSGGETVTSAPVTYRWAEVAEATYYYLWVNNASGTAIHKVWYTDAVCSGGVCSVTPSVSYTSGAAYSWWIQTWNSYGYGPWSDAATFTFDDGSGPPGVATLTSPSGGETVTSSPVTYQWNEVTEATYYYLWVNNASGTAIHKVWYTDAVCSGGVCSVTPSVSYTSGASYSWWIQTWNSYGYGPWSDAATFTFNDGSGPPGAATLTSPSGGETVTGAPVTYQWAEVAEATYYYLWVNDPSGTAIHKVWYTDAVCSGGVCSVTPSVSYTNGASYSWWIQTWNSYGYGLWSDAATFTFDDGSGPPGVAMLTSPANGETVTSVPVVYTWEGVAGADEYYLWINNAAGTNVYKQWHSAAAVCTGGACSFAPVLSYTSGTSYSWWIQARNSYGTGLWSDGETFTVDTMEPPAGVTYYVSSSAGSSGNDGLSEDEPFAAVSTVNSLALQAGDRVLFKCGDVWRADPLIITRSGTPGAPIVFGSYPADCTDQPVLSGAQPISGWSVYSGSIYVADLNTGANAGKFGYGVNQLFRGGTRLVMGRWPNLDAGDGGYSTIDGQPAANQIADNQLPAGDWTGAVAHIRGMRWFLINRRVSGRSGQTLSTEANATCWNNNCTGWGYFLNNHLLTLDQDGEWYYDAATHRVYLYSTSGTPSQTEGSVVLTDDDRSWGGITLGEDLSDPISYVIVENLQISGWYRHGIATPTNLHPTENHDLIIRNNTISDVDGIGINMGTWVWGANDGRPDGWRGGYNLTIDGNTISRANSMGINSYARQSSIINNTIRDVGLIENLGAAGMGCALDAGSSAGGICTEDGDGIRIKAGNANDSGNYMTVSGNRLERIAYSGMDVFGHHNTFTHNVIIQPCYAKGDCGGVRTFGSSSLSSTPVHDLTFQENIIVDTSGNTDGCLSDYDALFGFGLYIDHYSRDVTINGNTIIDSTVHGILFQNSTGSVTNNTLYNNGRTYPYGGAQVYLGSSPAALSSHTGNVLYNLNPDARTLTVSDVSLLGTSDNNYFFSPYRAGHIYANGSTMSLANWNAFSGKDAGSIEHWFTQIPGAPPISEIFYNDTSQVMTIDLGATLYKDLDQNDVSGSLTLQPYRSQVLITADVQEGFAFVSSGMVLHRRLLQMLLDVLM